jgi:hypothetical protein
MTKEGQMIGVKVISGLIPHSFDIRYSDFVILLQEVRRRHKV